MKRYKLWVLTVWLVLGSLSALASCTNSDNWVHDQEGTDVPRTGKIAQIVERGKLLVGTTGDYRPLSYREAEGNYWGFGIEMAEKIAQRIGVDITFVPTSWPTLSADVMADPQTFDFAIGGITITDSRKTAMLMSDGYLCNGKTMLCRAGDAQRFQSLADIDRPEVCVMVNPFAGGGEPCRRDDY